MWFIISMIKQTRSTWWLRKLRVEHAAQPLTLSSHYFLRQNFLYVSLIKNKPERFLGLGNPLSDSLMSERFPFTMQISSEKFPGLLLTMWKSTQCVSHWDEWATWKDFGKGNLLNRICQQIHELVLDLNWTKGIMKRRQIEIFDPITPFISRIIPPKAKFISWLNRCGEIFLVRQLKISMFNYHENRFDKSWALATAFQLAEMKLIND